MNKESEVQKFGYPAYPSYVEESRGKKKTPILT